MKGFALIIILLLSAMSYAQQPDRWRGLVIDESTPESAIKTLGKPATDKTGELRVYKFHEKFTNALGEKTYRRLEFRSVEGFSKVIVAFRDDKLVLIELHPKRLEANVLGSAYGVKFTPAFDRFAEALSTVNFPEAPRAGTYPSFYYLYAAAPATHLLAGIGTGSAGGLLGARAVIAEADFPGYVAFLQIISRSLENREDLELLK